MKREVTMTLIIALALIAVSLGFRQIILQPAEGVLNYSYLAALITAGVGLFLLFGVFIKRLLVKQA